MRRRRVEGRRAPPGLPPRRTAGDRWSDDEAEDERHYEEERRHPDEIGVVSRFGSERVQLVSITLHFSFTFHRISKYPEGRRWNLGRKAGLRRSAPIVSGAGSRSEQAAWRLGMIVPGYRWLEAVARSPSFETWDRICKLYGWPQQA